MRRVCASRASTIKDIDSWVKCTLLLNQVVCITRVSPRRDSICYSLQLLHLLVLRIPVSSNCQAGVKHKDGVQVNVLSQQLYSLVKTICNYFQVCRGKSKALSAQLQCINAAYDQCFSSEGLNAPYRKNLIQSILQLGKPNCREIKLPFQIPALNQHHPSKLQAS